MIKAVAIVVLWASALPGAEPMSAQGQTLSQAVAASQRVIRIVASGTLERPLELLPGEKLVCNEGVSITCQYAELKPCITVADDTAISNCEIRGKWTGEGVPPISYRAMHGVACYGRSVQLKNVRIANFTAGDGFYAGPRTETGNDRAPCRARISDSQFEANGRHGVGVCSGDLTLNNCRAERNGRTAESRAGYAFEPQEPGDRVQVALDQCQSIGNAGAPYFVNLDKLTRESEPPSLIFRGCSDAERPSWQPQTLRLAHTFETNGWPSADFPKGTTIQWDNLDLVKIVR